MEIFVGIVHEWDLHFEIPKRPLDKTAGIIYFEGETIAEAQLGIIRGSTDDALIADEGTSKRSRQFVFLRCVLRSRKSTNCQHCPDDEMFQRHFSSCPQTISSEFQPG